MDKLFASESSQHSEHEFNVNLQHKNTFKKCVDFYMLKLLKMHIRYLNLQQGPFKSTNFGPISQMLRPASQHQHIALHRDLKSRTSRYRMTK